MEPTRIKLWKRKVANSYVRVTGLRARLNAKETATITRLFFAAAKQISERRPIAQDPRPLGCHVATTTYRSYMSDVTILICFDVVSQSKWFLLPRNSTLLFHHWTFLGTSHGNYLLKVTCKCWNLRACGLTGLKSRVTSGYLFKTSQMLQRYFEIVSPKGLPKYKTTFCCKWRKSLNCIPGGEY